MRRLLDTLALAAFALALLFAPAFLPPAGGRDPRRRGFPRLTPKPSTTPPMKKYLLHVPPSVSWNQRRIHAALLALAVPVAILLWRTLL